MHRRDQPEIGNVPFPLGQKLAASPGLRFTRVQVPDPGREKLEELGCCVLASIGQDGRNGVCVAEG